MPITQLSFSPLPATVVTAANAVRLASGTFLAESFAVKPFSGNAGDVYVVGPRAAQASAATAGMAPLPPEGMVFDLRPEGQAADLYQWWVNGAAADGVNVYIMAPLKAI